MGPAHPSCLFRVWLPKQPTHFDSHCRNHYKWKNHALLVNSLLDVNGSWESQLTSPQGPPPDPVASRGCCKHSGDRSGRGGGQTSAPVGANTSFLKTRTAKQERSGYCPVPLRFTYTRGGFHVTSSHLRNYVARPCPLIGQTGSGVLHQMCPYHNNSALAVSQIPWAFDSN